MAFTSGNDINILQAADTQVVGAGAGNDTYILSGSLLAGGQQISISDVSGNNSLQLIGGLSITNSKISADALQLTLNNGAIVTVLGASNFSFTVGGNPLTGINGVAHSFQSFVTTALGAVGVPATGVLGNNNGIVINADGSTAITAVAGGTTTNSLLTQANAFSSQNIGITDLLSFDSPAVSGLTQDSSVKWMEVALTYGFPAVRPSDYSSDQSLTANWTPLNAIEQVAVRTALAQLAEIIPVGFSESAAINSDLRFSVVSQSGSSGFAISPTSGPFTAGTPGDVFLALSSRSDTSNYGYQAGDEGFLTVIHEIGHAVGLKHPFEAPTVLAGTDNRDYSVMSYTSARNYKLAFTENGSGISYSTQPAEPTNYALFDIAGLQALYGSNSQTRNGDSVYQVSSSNFEYLCIWDSGGTDLIDASAATGACTVDLSPGKFSTIDLWSFEQQKAATIAEHPSYGSWIDGIFSQYVNTLYTGENNLSIAYGAVIENVHTGSADDHVTDNKYNNQIATGAGNDTIALGLGGFDNVDGGSGTDTVTLSGVTCSQIQQEIQGDGSLLLLAPSFAVKLVGVEAVTCIDGALTLLT